MKLNVLANYYVQGDLRESLYNTPQIVGEFIKVTGRPARSDTFSSLKQRRELAKIFEQVSAGYRLKVEALEQDITRVVVGDIDMEKVTLQFILK